MDVAYSLCYSLNQGHRGLYQLYVGALQAGCLPEPGDADAELIARMMKTTTPGVGNVGVAQPNITEACDQLYSALEDICPSWPAWYTSCPLMDNVEYVTSGMAVRSLTALLLASLVIAFCAHSEVKDTISCDFMLATLQVRLFFFHIFPQFCPTRPNRRAANAIGQETVQEAKRLAPHLFHPLRAADIRLPTLGAVRCSASCDVRGCSSDSPYPMQPTRAQASTPAADSEVTGTVAARGASSGGNSSGAFCAAALPLQSSNGLLQQAVGTRLAIVGSQSAAHSSQTAAVSHRPVSD